MSHISRRAQGDHCRQVTHNHRPTRTPRNQPSIPGGWTPAPPRHPELHQRAAVSQWAHMPEPCPGPGQHRPFLGLSQQVGRVAQGAARTIGQSWLRPGLAAQLLPTITQGVVFPQG